MEYRCNRKREFALERRVEMKGNIKFSIHFDENGEAVAVTEPPQNIDHLKPLESAGEGPFYCKEGVEITTPCLPTILNTHDPALNRFCVWIWYPILGWRKKCWEF
jgi:hypothetical protein